ncbi:MAG: hypothetical protein HZB16_10245 [Armatimonadetes bacterium]|nr:hypothetical protein [Armatimonadota bacterium]
MPMGGQARFWVGINGKARWLLTSDQRFGPFDRIDDVHLSADGRHWACVVREGGRETLLRDGQPMSWHERVLSPRQLTSDDCCCGEGGSPFTADGQHVVWQVRDGQRETYLVDNRPVPIRQAGRQWHEAIPTGDGSHLLTASNPGDGVRYWVDGQPLSAKGRADDGRADDGGADDGGVTEEVVTGAGPAWAAVLGRAGRVFVVTHLGDFGPFERVTQPVISRTTGGMVWAAKAEGAWRIWRDGRPGEPVPTPDPPRFGPLGILTYCQVGDAKRRAMWVNGRTGPWFDSIDEQPSFSADGRHLAYGAKLGQRAVAVLDGKVSARMNRVERLTFAPTGRGLLVRGETGRWDLPWLAEAPLPPTSRYDLDNVAWSRDGRHWAYLIGQPGEQAVVHDGRRSEVVRRTSALAISPDGRHVVVVAVPKGKAQSDLLVDGRWLEVDSEIDSPGAFGPDGVYRRLVQHDGHTALIEIRWRR